jgi:hypothetical protein
MNFESLNNFLLFKTIRKDFKTNSHSTGPNLARGRRPNGCGGLLRQPVVSTSQPDWRGPAASPAWPAQEWCGACMARGHRAVATLAAAGWRGRRHLAGRPGVGEPTGIAHVEKGGGAGQGDRRRASPQ